MDRNPVGSVAIALLFAGGGGLADGVGDAAVALMASKLDRSAGAVFCSAILANMLVCLAVWMALTARTIPAKGLAIFGPVMIFVAAGLEHSIANMSILPLGYLSAALDASNMASGLPNLVFSTTGNIVGGSLVAICVAFGHDAFGKAGKSTRRDGGIGGHD